jgi:hypothetical protein
VKFKYRSPIINANKRLVQRWVTPDVNKIDLDKCCRIVLLGAGISSNVALQLYQSNNKAVGTTLRRRVVNG